MFGLLTDTPEEEVGWGRYRHRRVSFRDVDWAALAAASIGLTSSVVTAVSNATKPGTSSGTPVVQQQSCPAGYVLNPQTGMCQLVQQGGGFSINPMALAIGGGALLLILLSRKAV
jgi:hypothetical protein